MRFCGSEFFALLAPNSFDVVEFRAGTTSLVWAIGADGGKMPLFSIISDGYHGTDCEEAAEKSPTIPRRCGQPLPTDLEKQCYPMTHTFHARGFCSESVKHAPMDCTI
ncbi:MAG TPA: hypothetical protein VIT23_18595 [Terrimicrobiaceae bacterium]